ncbi:carbon-nitrogen hydrolase family protein [Undibacterium sp. Ji49W]|uniref:carbon-nitrogen hydrolase family protein n=1 Tax=Undibacterium sp. Ji49W TaxID=3413040 RepID=UPI003BF4183D
MQKIRVATFQRQPLFDDIAGTLVRLQDDLAWCDKQGVELAVFPECYLQGYTSDQQIIARRAIAVDSPSFNNILTKLSPFSSDVIIGFVEQDMDGFYNSAALISKGKLRGIYAKNHPQEQAFLPGRDMPVFQKSGFLFGINICFDANFPDCAKRLSAQAARLICYPLNNMLAVATADKWRHKSVENLRQRATETACWVVSSDVVGISGDKLSHGCTCIVNPQGDIVARVTEGVEGVVVFDVG